MKIILSPAKKMRVDTDTAEYCNLPMYLEDTKVIVNTLREKSYDELKQIWKCNDQIAKDQYQRLQKINLESSLTPAILSYEGIAFQYMAPAVFEDEQIAYIQEHLRILSAFYGILKPLDGVTPYRLEMQAKLQVAESKNLYDFWNEKLYQALGDREETIVNLASKEYSKSIEKYIKDKKRFLTVKFVEIANNKMVMKGTYAKMARGEMVRFMAENKIENLSELKAFDRLGYTFQENLSTEQEYIFAIHKDEKNIKPKQI